MNIKKIFIISLILMFLLVPVSFADDGDYTLPIVVKDVDVLDDGTTVIIENITYDIEGRINGVYRDIPVDKQQSISNISVETPGYFNTVEVIKEEDKTKIKVWIYKDEAKTRKVFDEKVEVIYKYTFNKGIKIYNDVAELQYMSWGDEWDSGVDSLVTYIHIPGSNEGTKYWNNPSDDVVSSEWTNNNTLTTKLSNIYSHTSFEQRILMPKSYFTSNDNAKIININAKSQIEADQQKYLEERERNNVLSGIFSFILGILMVIPLGIYGLFGREPKISYKKKYEYDLPTDATPIQVNSIVEGDVGEITDNAIYATILDLINRKYFNIVSSNDKDTIIKRTGNDARDLKDYEKSLIAYLCKFAIGNDISLKSIGDIETPENYSKFKYSWINQAKEEIPDYMITKFFDDKGSRMFSKLSFVLLIISMISFFAIWFIDIPKNFYLILIVLTILMFIESIIMICIPNTIPGKWTPSGKEFHDKWKNFEKYIKDFSLIKERPPASIEVWGTYLIYATSLGCAKEVSKNMKKYFDLKQVSNDYYYNSDVVLFAYYGGFTHMESSFSSLVQTDSNSGDIGSVGGGGFGGGGGGTF